MKYYVIYLFIMYCHHYGSACWLQRITKTHICSTVEEMPKEDAPKSWKKLKVSSSSQLKQDTFKNMPNLQSLECYDIGNIEKGTFSGLTKLNELYLFNIKLEEIPLDALENLSVKKLTISESNIKFLQPGLFKTMPKIETIDLSNNSIVEIPKGVFDNNSKLQTVLLANNKITSIADRAFENMNDLTTLNLENNYLSSFNSEMHLSTTYSLEKLYLSKNKLTRVTKDMFNTIPNLTELYLYMNKIESIEVDSLKNLRKLEVISFHVNEMIEVQKGIFDDTNIIELYLGNNRIERIADKAFEKMPELTHLSLRGNLLKSFNAELYLGHGYSLSSLWLANNLLTKITSDMFTKIPNLRELYLELNQIGSIQSETFYNTPVLRSLDLSNNNLREIKSDIFPYSGMEGLFILVLHNNQLTFINKALLYRTPNLRYISYAGNPFQCPCYEELAKTIKERNISRICDQYYLDGERPICVLSSRAPSECLYDEEIADELSVLYNRAIRDYSKLELKCVLSTGIQSGFLKHIEEAESLNRFDG